MGLTYFFIGLFLCLIGYVAYFVFSDRELMINNSYNPRQEMLAERTIRGSIYAGTGEVLAETTVSPQGAETRNYPFDELFAHAIGYASHGRMGIESIANYNLITPGVALGDKVKNQLKQEKDLGNNVYTTLDVELQKAAERALGVYKGAIIVTEPSTGKILAMVSKPDFNPNEIGEIWEEIVTDDSSTVLLNRTTQGLYPPGSTFKIVTALEYIRENPDSYEDYGYTCNGKFQLEDTVINCYHGIRHGKEDLAKSFAKSCNASFSNIATSLDKNLFRSTLDKLLFNGDLPMEFTYKESGAQVEGNTEDSQIIQMAIGQGTVQMSPLHMEMITAAIANQGVMMKPYMLDRVMNADGVLVKQYYPEPVGEVMTMEEAEALTGFMAETVKSGTATKLSGLSYTAAGKTGSAEYSQVKTESHAWFTGFAPVENPQIAVTIIIEGAGSGGDYAVPIAKRIFDAFFE